MYIELSSNNCPRTAAALDHGDAHDVSFLPLCIHSRLTVRQSTETGERRRQSKCTGTTGTFLDVSHCPKV